MEFFYLFLFIFVIAATVFWGVRHYKRLPLWVPEVLYSILAYQDFLTCNIVPHFQGAICFATFSCITVFAVM